MKEHEPHYVEQGENVIADSAEGAFIEAYCRLERALAGEGCTCLNCLHDIVNEYNRMTWFISKGKDPVYYYITEQGKIAWGMDSGNEVFDQLEGGE